jgi:hypothetical protein
MTCMAETPATLLAYTTVRTWFDSLQRQSGLGPAARHERLATLAAFCHYIGQAPDAIVAACLQDTAEGKTIRRRGRQYYAAQITAFQQQLPGDLRSQVRQGSMVRSFLIHNGVMLQAGWQYGPQP